ncbi:hypothetical protein AR158_c106R [Paramecium bursaria Chlorella virus AR158]|uniref:hypothetical protein n=1 Tax=Paramecium bursaria Chlorella virus AR158 TaxID=380598 RepID=UPI00015AA7B0|nr:hypothetical protein AR158_c106R [Paramecium bursaria Chlorella virus AR158]ABU43652.1 hypothetical protein AR158_c106R [Paramecium bursaria Chlorella virus AR158]
METIIIIPSLSRMPMVPSWVFTERRIFHRANATRKSFILRRATIRIEFSKRNSERWVCLFVGINGFRKRRNVSLYKAPISSCTLPRSVRSPSFPTAKHIFIGREQSRDTPPQLAFQSSSRIVSVTKNSEAARSIFTVAVSSRTEPEQS